MKKEIVGDWFDNHRILSFGIFLLIIWGSIFTLLYLKADEITKHPCQICSEKMGKDLMCVTQGINPIQIKFYENGTIDRTEPGRLNIKNESFINFKNVTKT